MRNSTYKFSNSSYICSSKMSKWLKSLFFFFTFSFCQCVSLYDKFLLMIMNVHKVSIFLSTLINTFKQNAHMTQVSIFLISLSLCLCLFFYNHDIGMKVTKVVINFLQNHKPTQVVNVSLFVCMNKNWNEIDDQFFSLFFSLWFFYFFNKYSYLTSIIVRGFNLVNWIRCVNMINILDTVFNSYK